MTDASEADWRETMDRLRRLKRLNDRIARHREETNG